MPEQLREKGVSWKCYSGDSFTPTEDPPMAFFSQYYSDPELLLNGLGPTFPATFMADVQSGNLPQVSWVWDSIVKSEHPPAPPIFGENSTDMILQALASDPELWSKTALFITWDENGGFFDHVPPPVPPPGTKGEKLTVATLPDAAEGIREPIGLGFRVPTLVVSPFSRGGFVCSDVFDHTSLLRFLERRFGAEVPNLSEWRRSTTGDLTSAFNFAEPRQSVPSLPASSLTDPRIVASDCPVGPLGLTGAPVPPYPVPRTRCPSRRRAGPAGPAASCVAASGVVTTAITIGTTAITTGGAAGAGAGTRARAGSEPVGGSRGRPRRRARSRRAAAPRAGARRGRWRRSPSMGR